MVRILYELAEVNDAPYVLIIGNCPRRITSAFLTWMRSGCAAALRCYSTLGLGSSGVDAPTFGAPQSGIRPPITG